MKKLDYLTRSQLQTLHGLKSEHNARRVLRQMEQYFSVRREGEYIYYLNANGRALVGCDKVRKGTGNVLHYVMRNSLYIAYGMPATWRNEIRIKNGSNKKDTINIVADAMFQREKRWHIVEVDNLQTMAKNRTKVEKYRILIGRGAFGEKPPALIWITKTAHRKKQLQALCEGIDTQVFTVSDFN